MFKHLSRLAHRFEYFRFGLRYYRHHWVFAVLTILLMALSAGIAFLPPLILRDIMDACLTASSLTRISWLSFALLAVILLSQAVGFGESYMSIQTTTRVQRQVLYDYIEHLMRLPLRRVEELKTGDILVRSSNDIRAISEAPLGMFIRVTIHALTLIGVAGVLISINSALTLVVILTWPIYFFASANFGSRAAEIHRDASKHYRSANVILEESFSGFLAIKALACVKTLANKMRLLEQESLRLSLRGNLMGRLYLVVSGVMGSIIPAFVFGIGGYHAMKGNLTIGELVAFYAYMQRVHSAISGIGIARLQFNVVKPAFDRVLEHIRYPEESVTGQSVVWGPDQPREVRFEHVCFQYAAAADQALKDISFTLKRNEITALVGPSGSGKSTIAYILLRLHTPDAGEIYIDGQPLCNIHPESLRRQVSFVGQSDILLNRTIRENLLYGCPSVAAEQVNEAAEQARFLEVVERLPQGYDTLVGERGIKLSGGERQRLVIARSILKDARLVILDEATAFLDSQTESVVRDAIDKFLRDRITLVIAHRLSTVINADQILVLSKGRLVEVGRHQQLINQDGLYAHLYRTQFKEEKQEEYVEFL